MCDQWERWMSESVHSVTIGGHIRKASYNVVYQWVKNAWSGVKESTIINSFNKSSICEFMSQNISTIDLPDPGSEPNVIDLPSIPDGASFGNLNHVDDLVDYYNIIDFNFNEDYW